MCAWTTFEGIARATFFVSHGFYVRHSIGSLFPFAMCETLGARCVSGSTPALLGRPGSGWREGQYNDEMCRSFVF